MFSLEAFRKNLTLLFFYMRKLKMLPKIDIVFLFYRRAQENAAQHTGGTVQYWRWTQKWSIHFFGDDGILITQTQKLMIASSSLHSDTCDQTDRPSTHPFHYQEPNIITFIVYWQPLPRYSSSKTLFHQHSTEIVKYVFHLGTITVLSGGDCLIYHYTANHVPVRSYYQYLLVFHW